MANTVHHDAERLIASVESLADQLTPPRRPQDRSASACSGPELRALRILGRTRQLRISELAEQLGTPLSTVSRIVDRLAAKGLAERARLTEDHRVVQVRFTRRGHQINRYVVDWRRSAALQMLKVLPSRERRLLLDALARMSGGA